jgi:hypothetical protein
MIKRKKSINFILYQISFLINTNLILIERN